MIFYLFLCFFTVVVITAVFWVLALTVVSATMCVALILLIALLPSIIQGWHEG